jgi:PST family polysaccharide transporter
MSSWSFTIHVFPHERHDHSNNIHNTDSEPAASAAPTGRVRSAIGWSYVLTAGRIGSSIVVMFLLAKLLGPREFGLLAMAIVFITIAQTIIQQGLISAIVQRDRLTADHLDAAFGVLVVAGLIGAAITIGLSPVWALINREPGLTAVCVALSPLVLLQGLATVPEAVLRRNLQFRSVAIRTLIASLLSGIVGVGLALAGAGIWALVGQQLLNSVISVVILWLICPWRPGHRPRLAAIRELWTFSAHSANAGLGLIIGSRADIICMGIFFGPVATGIYRLASRLPDMLVEVTVRSLQQVALPSLSRLQRDSERFAAHLTQLQHIGAVVGLPVLGALFAVAQPLVGLLGPQWDGTVTPLRTLCLLLGPALQAIGRPGTLAAIHWIRGALSVLTLATVGALMTGHAPVAQATAIALGGVGVQLLLNAITVWITVRRAAGTAVSAFLAPTVPALLAAISAAAVGIPAELLGAGGLPPIAGLAVIGAGAGLVAAVLLWSTDPRLRQLVLDRLRRRPDPDRLVGGPVPAAGEPEVATAGATEVPKAS